MEHAFKSDFLSCDLHGAGDRDRTGDIQLGKLTLPFCHFEQRFPNQRVQSYLSYFLLFANIAFSASRDTIRTCFPQFLEIVDSMDSKATGAILGIFSVGTSVGNIKFLERETGIEPATNGLGSRYSTIELLPL